MIFQPPTSTFQMLLIHTTECSSVYGRVIRCIRAEEAQLRLSDMVAHLGNWSRLEVPRNYTPFVGMANVPLLMV
jgi:hypothetical protein